MIWNEWYTACAASRLNDEPRACRILDQDIVLFRDASGKACALRDRCCHRGYKLSRGRVVDDTVECGFHGWRFNAEGRCVLVPSQCEGGRIPDAFCVRAFEVRERDGYVWVWMSKDGSKPSYEPGIPEFAGRRWLQGQGDIACSAMRALEINLDPVHIYFVHPSHPATVAFKANGSTFEDSRQEVRVTERGLVMFVPISEGPNTPIPAHAMRIYFDLPSLIRFENTDGHMLLLFIIPTGENTCRMEFLVTQYQPRPEPLVWLDEVPQILEEDREVLEVLQQTSDAEDAVERSVEADAVGLLARKIVALARSGRWQEARSAIEPRRVFRSRSGGHTARRLLWGSNSKAPAQEAEAAAAP